MRKRSRILWLLGLGFILSLAFLSTGAAANPPSDAPYPLGDFPLDRATYDSLLQAYPESYLAGLPAAYDARAFGWVTPARNQGSCGSCWAFASTGAMESHLLRSALPYDPADLAEQQLVSCDGSQLGCCGGNAASIRYWEAQGPVYETCFPYGDGATACPTNSKVPCANGSACPQLPYRITGFHTVSPTTDQFKASLYAYGPSYWRFTVYSDFDAYWAGAQPGDVYVSRSGASYRGGHAVLLIGWDDAKGAFLCKNSWGTSGGPNRDGTFWIAYTGHVNDLGFGMSNFSVVSTSACSSDVDCDDGIGCTVDVCLQPGTPQATCSNTWPACGTDDGCCGPNCAPGSDPDCACGDEICGGAAEGEDCNTCPEDCPSGTFGGTCAACFKGKCDGFCNTAKEGPACADCGQAWCCGDGTCGAGESNAICPADCPLPVCGDGACQPGETPCGCPGDCGTPPATETSCSNGLDDDCDGFFDCSDGDCAADPTCTCLPKGAVCATGSQCCSNRCRGGSCR